MTRGVARFVHAATLLVGGTGLVYGWQRYLFDPGPEPEDPAVAVGWTGAHPFEDEVRALHLLVAPLFLFACGLLWQRHVWARIVARFVPRRRTGMLLALLLVPMTVSGILVQTATSDGWRRAAVWSHATTGALWCIVYVGHQMLRRHGGDRGAGLLAATDEEPEPGHVREPR